MCYDKALSYHPAPASDLAANQIIPTICGSKTISNQDSYDPFALDSELGSRVRLDVLLQIKPPITRRCTLGVLL